MPDAFNDRDDVDGGPTNTLAHCGALAIVAMTLVAIVLVARPARTERRDLGREALARGDGWAALGEGTTGGALAAPDHGYTVRTRRELVAALNFPSPDPKIIYVEGTIDANVDDQNQRLTCESYHRLGYTREAFLAFYDPAGPWGPRVPENTSGSLEAARVASSNAQRDRIRIRVPDNTTIVGRGGNARMLGAQLDLTGTSAVRRQNIIIRNITFEDVFDCFPAWTPGTTSDGRWTGTGSWDAERDAIALRETERVWIDHNAFRDVTTPDRGLPTHFGAKYQIHDGHLDITNASDRVTVSWNRFTDHDKTMLIGSSDNAPGDVGRLRVTIHHNLFENVTQRAPRVRYGQVHVYNNYYRISEPAFFGYAWGVGFQPVDASGRVSSGIFAEENFFETDRRVAPERFISRVNGRAIRVSGTLHDQHSLRATGRLVDPLAAYNTARDPDLSGDVGWVPALSLERHPVRLVPALVTAGARPFAW